MNRIELVSRRGFLNQAFTAGALILGTRILPSSALASLGGTVESAAWRPDLFLGLETDGTVRILAHRSEMGTGIKTSLPMVLADELEADWTRVKVEQAGADKRLGDQDTDGSHSITDYYVAMRQIGATARLMLERAAAAQWSVPEAECKAHNLIWRTRGFGREAAAAEEGRNQAQDRGGIPLHRQGRADCGSSRHRDRARGLWHGYRAAGDVVRVRRAAAGIGREGALIR
jgi:isoquinoline 1-oxidoreductase beta subunit